MSKRRVKKTSVNVGKSGEEVAERVKLTPELTESESELAKELSSITVQVHEKMSGLEAVLKEIEFRRETADSLHGIREDLRTANKRIDEEER